MVAQLCLTLVSPVGWLIEPAPAQRYLPTGGDARSRRAFHRPSVSDRACSGAAASSTGNALKAGRGAGSPDPGAVAPPLADASRCRADLVSRIRESQYAEIISDESLLRDRTGWWP